MQYILPRRARLLRRQQRHAATTKRDDWDALLKKRRSVNQQEKVEAMSKSMEELESFLQSNSLEWRGDTPRDWESDKPCDVCPRQKHLEVTVNPPTLRVTRVPGCSSTCGFYGQEQQFVCVPCIIEHFGDYGEPATLSWSRRGTVPLRR